MTTPTSTHRPDASEYKPYYDQYVQRVPDGPIVPQLESQIGVTMALLRALSEAQAERRYAPGKWSVKEVIGHVIDAERVFAYRALRVGRNDPTPLASFDQDLFVANAHSDRRTLADLLDEFASVRQATVTLFRSLDAEALLRRGTASDATITPRALGFIIAGHELHHIAIVQERYL